MNPVKVLSITCATLFSLVNPGVRAGDLYVWTEQVVVDTVFHFEGSIDTTGFPTPTSFTLTPAILPRTGAFIFCNVTGSNFSNFSGVVPDGVTRTFGMGDNSVPDSTTGDIIGTSGGTDLALPENYVSGTRVSGTMTFSSITPFFLEVDTTPFTFDTTVGTNTIHMFTRPPIAVDNSALKLALLNKIKKLKKKAKKVSKKGKKAKAKKLKKKVKKLNKRLKALG